MKADQICIEGLEIFAHHGVYQEEKEKGQPFYVNLYMDTDTSLAGLSDNLHYSVDYGEVCHFVQNYLKEHSFNLLEACCENLARELLLKFELLSGLTLEIEKPKAPIPARFKSVSVKVNRKWNTVFVALGSNLGEREHFLEDAVVALKESAGIRVEQTSDWIVTKAYGVENQPDFLNGMVKIKTILSPHELLEVLHEIEQDAGRERIEHWGPRTLDLDIIFYEDLIMDTDDLIIPHVDMHNREFVLKPMCQLCPGYIHPGYKVTVQTLYDQLQNKE